MEKGFLRLAVCIALLAIFLICHVERQNEITRLRLQIPQIDALSCRMKESALQLQSKVIKSQSPGHLLALLDRPEFQHLHFPTAQSVWIIEENHSSAGKCASSGRT